MIDPALRRFPSVVHALRASVARYPDRPALICRERTLSYAALGRAVHGVAAQLVRLRAAGQRVLVALPTSIEAVVAVLGVLAAGAQVVPINPFFTRSELEALLGELDARWVICGAEARDKLQQLAGRFGLELAGFDAGARELRLVRPEAAPGTALEPGGAASGATLPELAPEQRAVALFTGGTTGEPKAVEHTHASTVVSVLQHCTVWPVRFGAERFASAAPIFHIWGLFYATFVPLYAGGTLVIIPATTPTRSSRRSRRSGSACSAAAQLPSISACWARRASRARSSRACATASRAGRRARSSCTSAGARRRAAACSRAGACPKRRRCA